MFQLRRAKKKKTPDLDMPAFDHSNKIGNTKETRYVLCQINDEAIIHKNKPQVNNGNKPTNYSTATFSETKKVGEARSLTDQNTSYETYCCCLKRKKNPPPNNSDYTPIDDEDRNHKY